MSNKYLVKTIDKETIQVEGIKVNSKQKKSPTIKELILNMGRDILNIKQEMKDGFTEVNRRLDDVEKDITVIKQDVKLMKNTPTMKRELNKN